MEYESLLEVVKDWIKREKYVSITSIQKSFSVGFVTASKVFNALIDDGLIEKDKTYLKGNKVIGFNIGLKIYLLDMNAGIVNAWKEVFKDNEEITIIHDTFRNFMDNHKDIECVVSPANAYGIMNGGYDLAISEYFGNNLQHIVQRYIKKNLYGEQPVGSSIIVDIPNTNKKLIHTPTMQIPSLIKDDFLIYQCMRTTLIKALENNVKSIVIPAFGGCCGGLSPKIISKRMKEAYEQIRTSSKVHCSNL